MLHRQQRLDKLATMEAVASIGTKSGKYYVRMDKYIQQGLLLLLTMPHGGTQLGVYSGGINNSLGGTTSGSGFSFTSDDVIALAVDFDNKIAYVYKNNILQYTRKVYYLMQNCSSRTMYRVLW